MIKISKFGCITFIVIISIVVGSGIWWLRTFMRTPQFALYLSMKAIEEGKPGELFRYVDTESLANQIIDVSIDLKKEEAGVNLVKGKSLESVKSAINLICKERGKDAIVAYTKKQLERGMTDLVQKKYSGNAISFIFADIKENGNKATLFLPLKNTSGSLPFVDFLEKQLPSEKNILLELINEENQWRVIGIDRRQLELLIKSQSQSQNWFCG